VVTLRAPAPAEEGEPRWQAWFWLILTSLWSVELLFASLWPGAFEQDWAVFFVLHSIVIVGAWMYVLAKLAMNRRRASGSSTRGGPRGIAIVWLTAALVFSALLAIFSAREALPRPQGFLWVLAQTAPWLLAVYFVARIVLRELPVQLAKARDVDLRVRIAAVAVLRALSVTTAILLTASSRLLDGFPPGQALILGGLALLGGVHLALEVVIHELPRGARTLWLGSLAIVMATVSFTLVLFGLPRRAIFELFRQSFDARAADGREGPQRIGPWRVHRELDPRGGVFFSAWSGQKDSDCSVTFGFAHRPNSEGTPFGDRLLELQPLGADWYEFQVCD
jgi:hypothetical protein